MPAYAVAGSYAWLRELIAPLRAPHGEFVDEIRKRSANDVHGDDIAIGRRFTSQ